MMQSNSRSGRLNPSVLAMLIATVAVSALAALWSAPAANADINVDGNYLPSGATVKTGQIPAHLHIYSPLDGPDVSQAAGTLTMGDCTIDLYSSNSGEQYSPEGSSKNTFVHSHASSGSGPNCRDSQTISVDANNLGGGKIQYVLSEIDNGAAWILGANT